MAVTINRQRFNFFKDETTDPENHQTKMGIVGKVAGWAGGFGVVGMTATEELRPALNAIADNIVSALNDTSANPPQFFDGGYTVTLTDGEIAITKQGCAGQIYSQAPNLDEAFAALQQLDNPL